MTHGRAPTERFSDRVADYVRYRPSYPAEAIDWVLRTARLHAGDTVADVGAGTGISARLFLERGLRVCAVEPNADMRAAAEAELGAQAGFTSSSGRAERTGLPDRSVAAVVAAQAFHWFDPAPTRVEWQRVLHPGGWAVLLWNHRDVTASEFMRGYELLLNEHCPEYPRVGAEHVAVDLVEGFLAPGPIERATFRHQQVVDWAGLVGRLRSSSYVPKAGPDHDLLMADFERLFGRCARHGSVTFEYNVRCWAAPLT